MELYNFYTPPYSEPNELEALKNIYDKLVPICIFVQLVPTNLHTNDKRMSIIGQIYGDDTTAGDLEVLDIFSSYIGVIKYGWFNVYDVDMY